MADYQAELLASTAGESSPGAPVSIPAKTAVPDPAPAVVKHFKMTGTDALTPARGSWVVTGAPDMNGSQYAGPLSTPLRFVAVSAEWSV